MIKEVFAVSAPVEAAGVVQIQQLIQRITNIVVDLAFVTVLIVLFWGGIKYLASGGDPKNIEEANRIVTWALLGIVFLALAFLILRLVEAFTGVPVTKFCIGFPGAGTGC
jgi:TRAP-type C4-dicarboxylate transport system permease small subunit